MQIKKFYLLPGPRTSVKKKFNPYFSHKKVYEPKKFKNMMKQNLHLKFLLINYSKTKIKVSPSNDLVRCALNLQLLFSLKLLSFVQLIFTLQSAIEQ